MSTSRIETEPFIHVQPAVLSDAIPPLPRHLELVYSAPDAITDIPVMLDLHSTPPPGLESPIFLSQKPIRYSPLWSNYNKYNPSYRNATPPQESSSEFNLELDLVDQSQRGEAIRALGTFKKSPSSETVQKLAGRVLADIKKPRFHYNSRGVGIPQPTRLGRISLLETTEGYKETVVASPTTLFEAKLCLQGIFPARGNRLEFEAFVQTVVTTALLIGMTDAKLAETYDVNAVMAAAPDFVQKQQPVY